MKFLQGNPLGMVMAGFSGLFLLLALGMAVVWSLPVPVEITESETGVELSSDSALTAGQVGELRDYLVITEKPVFNESRLPVIDEIDESLLEDTVDETIAITGAPEVRLTGIIITPSMKIASLTPNDATQEGVMAHEGESLIGEYVGWHVSTVNARDVVLESRDGQRLSLELQVHDVAIKEPPKPEPIAKAEQGQSEDVMNDDDEPLSRAEQIRQRIAERREELRREQESQQGQSASQAAQKEPVSNVNAYQNALRARKRNSKDNSTDDKDDG